MERMTGVEPYTPPWHHAPSILESLKFQPFTVIEEGFDHVVFLKVLPQCYLRALAISRPTASETVSKSLSKRSAYRSRVIAALLCPSIRWRAFTLAPECTAMLAAVCLRS